MTRSSGRAAIMSSPDAWPDFFRSFPTSAGRAFTGAITSGPAGRISTRPLPPSCRARSAAPNAPSSIPAGDSGSPCSPFSIASTTTGTCRGLCGCSPSQWIAARSCWNLSAARHLRRDRRASARRPPLVRRGPALLLVSASKTCSFSASTPTYRRTSAGARGRPFPAVEQEPFTRSLRLPPLVSRFILHFDAHELHHMYPFVPGYHLHRIPTRRGTRSAGGTGSAVRSRCAATSCSFRTGSNRGRPVTNLDPLACAMFLLAAFTLAGLAQTTWFASPVSRARAAARRRGDACAAGACSASTKRFAVLS